MLFERAAEKGRMGGERAVAAITPVSYWPDGAGNLQVLQGFSPRFGFWMAGHRILIVSQ